MSYFWHQSGPSLANLHLEAHPQKRSFLTNIFPMGGGWPIKKSHIQTDTQTNPFSGLADMLPCWKARLEAVQASCHDPLVQLKLVLRLLANASLPDPINQRRFGSLCR